MRKYIGLLIQISTVCFLSWITPKGWDVYYFWATVALMAPLSLLIALDIRDQKRDRRRRVGTIISLHGYKPRDDEEI